MGATWPNLGPRCAPDSLTLLNIGPTKSQRERQRERERDRERETERQRERERQTDRQREGQRERERDRETDRQTDRERQRDRERERQRERETERDRETERQRPRQRDRERERGTSPAHTQTQIGRRPAVRRKPLKSGRRPRARVLAGGLRLVTEGYIRSPPLPPTLLLDRGETPCRPPPKSARQIYMYLALDVRKMFKNIVFYSVSWPSASTTGCPWCQLCVPRGQA